MGDPRKPRKKYKTPGQPWQKQRIEHEKKIMNDYGLKNKREIRIADAFIFKYRTLVRRLAAKTAAEKQREEASILKKLKALGILGEDAKTDDVLGLTAEAVLERRLQTIVWKKQLASTPKQARQFITHGKIALDGRRTTAPGRLVTVDEEKRMNWSGEPVKVLFKQTVEKPAEKPAEKPKQEAPEPEAEQPLKEEALLKKVEESLEEK